MNTLSIEQDTFKPFFQLSKEAIKKLWDAPLTSNDWKVYSFLSLLDPFGDRYCELPNLNSICQLLQISPSTLYRAMNKLRDNSIIDAKVKGVIFQNLLGFAKMKEKSQPCLENVKTDNNPSELTNINQNCENRELKPREDKGSSVSQTFQTPQTFSYSPDPDGEKQKEDKQETEQEGYLLEENVSTKDKVENISSSSQNLNQETQVSTLDLNQDKNLGVCSTNEETNNGGEVAIAPVEKPILRSKGQLTPVQQRNWQWLPDGAWSTPEGKLDPNFHEWLAKEFFMKELGNSNIFLAKANVLAYFKNDLDRLSFRWEQYHEEYKGKLENTATLLDHGIKIPDDRRENTIKRVRAVLPVAEQQSVSTKPTDINSNLQSLESIVNGVNSKVNPQLNPAVEEIEAEVISAETINDPWSEESAITKIEVEDTQIQVENTNIHPIESNLEVTESAPKYTVIDNSDCPDPEVLSLVYRDFTGIAEQMEKEKREAKPINPLAKAMTEDFLKLFTGKPITRPESERIEVINYALIHDSKNKYFIAQAQQFINQGWKAEYNDEGEVTKIIPNSKTEENPTSNLEVNSEKSKIDPNRLIEIAKELNEILKDKILRSSSYYINQVKEFLSLGKDHHWLADYDADGFPTEVFQF